MNGEFVTAPDGGFLMTFDAEPPNGPHEGDYRRGYHQGAHAILEALKEGFTAHQLEAFVGGELREWRSSLATLAFPPYPTKIGAAIDPDEMLIELAAELNCGVGLMQGAGSEQEKLEGARMIKRVGQHLVDTGGINLLRKAYGYVAPEAQRQVELEWFGLTDADGYQWLP